MRIALIADEDPGWGGIGTYTGVLGAGLRDLGHEVHLVLRGWEDERLEMYRGMIVHRVLVPEPSWRRGTVAAVSRLFTTRESLIFSARAARALARIAPDVVEAPEFHAPGLVAALRARLRRKAPSVVVRLHAPTFVTAALAAQRQDIDLRACEALEAASAHLASAISSPSEALAQTVRRRWRIPEDRVYVVPNPIDDDLFAPAEHDLEKPGSILVVGRVERGKGQDVLLRALPSIMQSVPEAHVRIVGADGGIADRLAQQARGQGTADVIAFEGARAREELPDIYRSSSVCVVPSRFEAFPYTCVEAMSCGRAVVAARAGGLAEVIADGSDGVLVDPESPAALASGVVRLLRDAPERRRLGEAARDRVLSSFAARRVAAQMIDRYEKIAA